MATHTASPRLARIGWIITVAAVALIAVATLTPSASPTIARDWRGFATSWGADALLADFLRNIVLFFPFGFGLRLGGTRVHHVFLVGVILSMVVEVLQATIVPGRDPSVLDWTSNSVGTFIGAYLASHHRLLIVPSPRRASQLSVGILALWLGLLGLGAWAIQPAPTNARYWGERTPGSATYVPYRGELVDARVNGTVILSAPLPNDDVRAALRAGELQVTAVVRSGPPPYRGLAPIVRVVDDAGREILLLAQLRYGMVFRFRMRATALGLETPGVLLPHAFAAPVPGHASRKPAPDSLTVLLRRGHVRLTVNGERGERVMSFALRPSLVWSFGLPWQYNFGPGTTLWSALWSAVLLIPAGYFAGVANPHPTRLALLARAGAGMAIPCGLGMLPVALSLSPAPVAEWLAAFFGLFLGLYLGRYLGARGVQAT